MLKKLKLVLPVVALALFVNGWLQLRQREISLNEAAEELTLIASQITSIPHLSNIAGHEVTTDGNSSSVRINVNEITKELIDELVVYRMNTGNPHDGNRLLIIRLDDGSRILFSEIEEGIIIAYHMNDTESIDYFDFIVNGEPFLVTTMFA